MAEKAVESGTGSNHLSNWKKVDLPSWTSALGDLFERDKVLVN